MWPAPVSTDSFDEAIDWFLSRVPLSDSERLRIREEARSRSFWVAGVSQMSILEYLSSLIDVALANGTTFEEFKSTIADKTNAFSAAHLSTVYRNATQSSYNAGRWRQMREPAVKQFRPYWMYDSVLDSSTTPICSEMNGTVASADDPMWDYRTPPLHHNCRSSVRSLRRSEAEKRGISPTFPAVDVEGGWGLSPSKSQDPEIDLSKRNQEFVAELNRKRKLWLENQSVVDPI